MESRGNCHNPHNSMLLNTVGAKNKARLFVYENS